MAIRNTSVINPLINCYILYLSNGTYYTGITNNIQRRLKEHQTGQSISTKFHRPVLLVYCSPWPNRRQAHKAEIYIKRKGALKFLYDPAAQPHVVYTMRAYKQSIRD